MQVSHLRERYITICKISFWFKRQVYLTLTISWLRRLISWFPRYILQLEDGFSINYCHFRWFHLWSSSSQIIPLLIKKKTFLRKIKLIHPWKSCVSIHKNKCPLTKYKSVGHIECNYFLIEIDIKDTTDTVTSVANLNLLLEIHNNDWLIILLQTRWFQLPYVEPFFM